MILRIETRRHPGDVKLDELRVQLSKYPPLAWRERFEWAAEDRSTETPWLEGDWAAIAVARGEASRGLAALSKRIRLTNELYQELWRSEPAHEELATKRHVDSMDTPLPFRRTCTDSASRGSRDGLHRQ